MTDSKTPETTLDQGGAYELLSQRLTTQGGKLAKLASDLNERRLELFGGTELAISGALRLRTENNCVPRDMVQVGGLLLFGYNVFIGLKTETRVGDVFSLNRLVGEAGAYEVEAVPLKGSFLDHPQFVKEFRELYAYYKEAYLTALRVLDGKLLAVFQTGTRRSDFKVFRWGIDRNGSIEYIDNRGERDHTFPHAHDFEWTTTTRENHVAGKHPHVSILERLFVETTGGDLTIKVENNTESGLGIYREPVEDANQSLADAQIGYADLGELILLRIRPYREEQWRHLVYNSRTEQVVRIDAIGQACVQLPEGHGLIFPGGYYLVGGEHKLFDGDITDLEFKRTIRSPNGEDVLYVFHHYMEGRQELLSYNLIRKQLANPIVCHGYSLFDDGRMVVFRYDSDEPTRVHPMQIWQTPYMSDEHAASRPTDGSPLARIGNADLVRGISDALSIRRMVTAAAPTVGVYEALIAACTRMADHYHWLDQAETGPLLPAVKAVRATAELVLGEFEKVAAQRKQAASALEQAAIAQQELLRNTRPESWHSIDPFITALAELRGQRGQLITLREMRRIDTARIDALEQEVVEAFERLSRQSVDFLLRDDALDAYHKQLDEQAAAIEAVEKVIELDPIEASLEQQSEGLELLNEVLGGLKVEDATQRTTILERVGEVFARLNRTRAELKLKRKGLRSHESVAEFAAEFKLYGQSVTAAISQADTPEACDEQLARLLLQLEELEGRFSEFDDYLNQLTVKREEVYESFEARKQQLNEERQRRAQNLSAAADRILQGVERRVEGFNDQDAINAYFAADPMILKLRELVERLRSLGDSVRADDVESRLKAARDQSGRTLRDRSEIFEEGGNVIRLGKHRFSVTTSPLDLTLLPVDGKMSLHLTGTDFFEPVEDERLAAYRAYWEQERVSEDATVYRAEYLAASLLFAAEASDTLAELHTLAADPQALLTRVRKAAAERYEEGYERGVHDVDAAAILTALLDLHAGAGLLRFGPRPRALAWLYWAEQGPLTLQRRARSLGQLAGRFGAHRAEQALVEETTGLLAAFCHATRLDFDATEQRLAAAYLIAELRQHPLRFTTSREAEELVAGLRRELEQGGQRAEFEEDLEAIEESLADQYQLVTAWLEQYLLHSGAGEDAIRRIPAAAALLLTEGRLDYQASATLTRSEVSGLLGQHPRIQGRTLALELDEFLQRLEQFGHTKVPAFRAYRQARREVAAQSREALRLEEFKPRPLTSFVRNQLINEVYLPLIGDNLAKQMGALGDSKRTDLMGMLLLISPPGYGKTTLMEYTAHRLGLIFMKINCPTIGHAVTGLDPVEAPGAAAKQELEKLNLALEMGNNVMLYLDDIQHTNPEFLQKFISLADGTRRVEGVWRGRSRSYDLRGKRFCIIMAGNPYTESGEAFKIPDMLANRADIYNLGDVLGGKEQVFSLSYLENALTSNATLAPLATRDMDDLYKLIRMAKGEEISSNELSHGYSGAELAEITGVLKKLLRIQDAVLKVNLAYIESASQHDAYRTEPPFKLQGSYRNMNKMAEKVVAVMNNAELEAMIDDHYIGEAQTLTTGAEENLLKLAALRNKQSKEQAERWHAITQEYRRRASVIGDENDPATRIAGQLAGLGQQLEGISQSAAILSGGQDARMEKEQYNARATVLYLQRLNKTLQTLSEKQPEIQLINPPLPAMQELIEQLIEVVDLSLKPMLRSLHEKNSVSDAVMKRLQQIEQGLKGIRGKKE